MPIENWLAVAAAVILSVFVALFASPGAATAPPVSSTTSGLATLGTVASSSIPALSLPNLIGAANQASVAPLVPTQATSSPVAAPTAHATPATTPKAAPAQTPKPQPPVAAPSAITAAPTTAATNATSSDNLDTVIGLVRGALVNIICVPTAANLKSASATGVIVDPRGIIMTVAHMAQFFLLANYPQTNGTTCVIRTGSPAQTAYTASLIYISPEWIKNNSSVLVESVPIGTGEDDFAFLAITGTATNTPLPSSFPSIPLSTEDPAAGESVTIGSYGAEFLDTQEIESALYPIVVFGSIADRFTFQTSTEDLISVTNTAAAQEGSSGGVIVNGQNQAVGLITTSSLSSGSVTTRTLHAITTNYIRRAFEADTGKTLDSYLSNTSLPALVQNFKSQAAELSSYLEDRIQ